MIRRFAYFSFIILSVAALSWGAAGNAHAQEARSFKAADGLEITADFYAPSQASSTAIVLFHQAGSSRGEYRQIAPRLRDMGYNVLAVDQRSGGSFGGVNNETARRAGSKGFTAAIPDLIASINYARTSLGAQKVVIWGSSYSASLSIVLAGEKKAQIDGVLSFSPGEYFKGNPSVKNAARGVSVPVFITAAKSETSQWQPIFNAIPSSTAKTGYKPTGQGKHGSSALYTRDAAEYWNALSAFLNTHFPI